MREIDEEILTLFKRINDGVSEFTLGILQDSISRDDQIAFAHRLVNLAELIRDRALRTHGLVIEGSVIDDSDTGTNSALDEDRSHDQQQQSTESC